MTKAIREDLPSGEAYKIRGGEYENKILTLGRGQYVDTLAQGAVFKNCELRVAKIGRQSFNFDAHFISCDIRPKDSLRRKDINDTTFIGCTFWGKYFNCSFGPKFPEDKGQIKGCDFSSAILHGCELFQCSVEDLSLPAWPHIYLLLEEDLSWVDKALTAPLPPNLTSLLRSLRGNSVHKKAILTLYLPEYDCEPEKVWPLIQDVAEIWFPNKDKKARASQEEATDAAEENTQAGQRLQRSKERMAIFNLMHRSWLKTVEKADGKDPILVFDCSFLQERVRSAPGIIKARLNDGAAYHRTGNEIKELSADIDRFMVMGVAEEGDDVILKPHRKERGQIKLSFDTYTILNERNEPVEKQVIADVVRKYWATEWPDVVD